MSEKQPNNPLHGIKLADIVTYLVQTLGWEEMGKRVKINCFKKDPSVKSSLKFLRRTDWARKEVEELYLKLHRKKPIPLAVKAKKKVQFEEKIESKIENNLKKENKPKGKIRKFSRK